MQRRVGPQMANRLIWDEHTKTFPQFIAEIGEAKAGNALIEHLVLERGRIANKRMKTLMDSATGLMDGNRAMAEVLTARDIAAIRTNKNVPGDILRRIFEISDSVSQGFRGTLEEPILEERGRRLGDDFLFRVGVGVTASFLEWVSNGCPAVVKAEKIRNDYVDSMLSVFGTYFNGVMSGDKRLHSVHLLNLALLRIRGVNPPRTYGCPSTSV